MSEGLVGDPANVIELWTRNGPCEVHLLSGDITQLPVEDKVDIIMVSAFPGDYAALPGTVLGALKKKLDIDIGLLSYDKDLDLRHHFSCWLSKTIKNPSAPYKKVLCYERRKNEMSQSAQISDMFRVFTPVFNNQDHTVITPLLATGHQKADKADVCKVMVNAACHWITAGLPLRCLKIVSYEEISDEIKKDFKQLKEKYLAKTEKLKQNIFKKKYDVYISFNPSDQMVVQIILQSLQRSKSDVRVYSEVAHYNKKKVWQDQIFKHMVASRRIIAVLSTSFMESKECLEQYNMAMCCNRLVGLEVLAPFYIENITTLPTYMGLVQWIDCRVRKEGETSESKIEQACSTILKAIEAPEEAPAATGERKESIAPDNKYKYDVFIPYSHKNPDMAEAVLKTFKTFDESVKVFYDRSSLTTGVNWQNTLYQCLGESRCVIALLSPAYLTSPMCLEEYSLALARYLSKDKGMTFIPMCVDRIDVVPPHMCKVPILDAYTDFGIVTTRAAEMVCRWLNKKAAVKKLDTREDTETIENIFSEMRTKALKKQYWVYRKTKDYVFQRITPLKLEPREDTTVDTSVVDVALIYANDAMHMAGTFCSILDTLYPGLNISVQTMKDHKRMDAFDKAKRIVIFVSQEMLNTSAQMSELHLALCRQRQTTDPVLYLIKTTPLHKRPFFPRILPYQIACTDPIWDLYEKTYLEKPEKWALRKTIIHRKSDRMQHSSNFTCGYGEYFALTKAAEDILECIVTPSKESAPVPPILLNVIACDLELHNTVTVDIPVGLPAMEEEKAKEERSKSGRLLSKQLLAEIEQELLESARRDAEENMDDDTKSDEEGRKDKATENTEKKENSSVPNTTDEKGDSTVSKPNDDNDIIVPKKATSVQPLKSDIAKPSPGKKISQQATLEPVAEEGSEENPGPISNEKIVKNGGTQKQMLKTKSASTGQLRHKSSSTCTLV